MAADSRRGPDKNIGEAAAPSERLQKGPGAGPQPTLEMLSVGRRARAPAIRRIDRSDLTPPPAPHSRSTPRQTPAPAPVCPLNILLRHNLRCANARSQAFSWADREMCRETLTVTNL